MKKAALVVLMLVFLYHPSYCQSPADYPESEAKVNDLVHTKLSINFNYSKETMAGKAWITLEPHLYSTDSLELDAKQMDIATVALVLPRGGLQPLQYSYDSLHLKISLGRTYRQGNNYTVFIAYTSKTGEAAKKYGNNTGLHFVNPHDTIKDLPVQVWTDGETEYTSFWCPTVDKPNQKSTLELALTVPAKYLTLSNGTLINQHKNEDGTRTDNWAMTQPIAPYVFFMAAGDFAVVKDSYHGIPVDYYVEKAYSPVARKIFGLTPAMMDFFSSITGVPYPWPKYAQVALRQFTSTAMENTSVTAHAAEAQQDAGELVDQNRWENDIAHELFHQWFGDYVTCESWGNLVLNEGFANYGQYLWKEHYYGKDAADEENYNNMMAYLGSGQSDRNLVRFNYESAEDMFDDVSYQKGGCVLNLLRHYIGDSAFFKGLHLYLTANRYKSAEVHQLRLAFEEVSGRDLNPFFNQWLYNHGHPVVDIQYTYDDAAKKATVVIAQKQAGDTFRFPLDIDVYENSTKTTHPVWINSAADTVTFNYATRPSLINVDAGKYMLWEKTDHKTLENYIYQYKYAGNYIDRLEAINFCFTRLPDAGALTLVMAALKDRYWSIRYNALRQVAGQWAKLTDTAKQVFEPLLLNIVKSETNRMVLAQAIGLLGQYKNATYAQMFRKAAADSSYSVAAAALTALAKVDSTAAFAEAKKHEGLPMKRSLTTAVLTILMNSGLVTEFDFIYNSFNNMPVNGYKLSLVQPFASYIAMLKDPAKIKSCINLLIRFRDTSPDVFKKIINEALKGIPATE